MGFVDFNPSTRHDLRSITKSVTSLLPGIALGRRCPSCPQPARPGDFSDHADVASEDSDTMTLFHVLTMTAGWDWNEMEVPKATP